MCKNIGIKCSASVCKNFAINITFKHYFILSAYLSKKLELNGAVKKGYHKSNDKFLSL